MKICYIGSLANVHTKRWIEFFIKQNHVIDVISTTEFDDCPEGITAHNLILPRTKNYLANLIFGFLIFPINLFKLSRLLKKINPDLVHVHYINDAALLAILTGFQPIILTAWGSDIT